MQSRQGLGLKFREFLAFFLQKFTETILKSVNFLWNCKFKIYDFFAKLWKKSAKKFTECIAISVNFFVNLREIHGVHLNFREFLAFWTKNSRISQKIHAFTLILSLLIFAKNSYFLVIVGNFHKWRKAQEIYHCKRIFAWRSHSLKSCGICHF